METRIIRAGTGEILGPPAGCRDRFLVDSKSWGGHLGVVEHLLAPHSIAAPMHRHSREDEFSFILEGRVWAQFGDEEHVAEVGDLVFKPRGEWHTFWNASDEPARLLELITPGGLEEPSARWTRPATTWTSGRWPSPTAVTPTWSGPCRSSRSTG